MRVKPHLLDQYRPTHKPCYPSGNTHWGPAIPDLPYSVAILEPQNVIHLLWRCFVPFCVRGRWAFPRASRRASQDLSQGPAGLSGSQTQAKAKKTGPSFQEFFSGAFRGCKGTFQNPPQPLPGLTGLQGFQAKPLQTAPSDSSGALKAPPISLNKEMAISNESG